jgi:hypothetical protein
MGPFVDAENPLIKEEKVQDLPFQIFNREILQNVKTFLQASPQTKVILIPSLRDIFHDYSYPQSQFKAPDLPPVIEFVLKIIFLNFFFVLANFVITQSFNFFYQ